MVKRPDITSDEGEEEESTIFQCLFHGIQGVSTQTCILHFALMGRNMQASFGLKVFWES